MTRKLIVQMQISVDGFVEAEGDQPWQVWSWGPDCPWDPALQRAFNESFTCVDCVLLSRPMVEEGYIDHWARIAARSPEDGTFAFAHRIGKIEKVIATRDAFRPRWERTRVLTGEHATTVATLKAEPGADILTFGGVRFVSGLLARGLVDELQLYVNPALVGAGRRLDWPRRGARLLGAAAYECGIVVSRYAL